MSLDGLDHEHVEIHNDPETGLLSVVAVHSTALGPAMGGVRCTSYLSLGDAVADALRLSRAMTIKNCLAGLPLGGGKSVIVDTGSGLSDAALDAFATQLQRLGGLYVAAEDIGTTPADMDRLAARTRWVAGRSPQHGGSGDPSPATARTVLCAIEHAQRVLSGSQRLAGTRVGVVGVGKVGSRLVALLRERGAEVLLSDLDAQRASEVAEVNGASMWPVHELLGAELDILAPCAKGGLINEEDVASLRARVVCGAANNILEYDGLAKVLADAGVLYVPDFLANAGGAIQVAGEFLGWSDAQIQVTQQRSSALVRFVLEEAAASGQLPLNIALACASQRLSEQTAATDRARQAGPLPSTGAHSRSNASAVAEVT